MSSTATLMVAACMGIFIYGYLSAMLGVVLPNLMGKLSVDKAQAGRFFMSVYIGQLVSSVPSGPAMDRFGTKMVLALGLALITFAFLGLGTIDTGKLLYPLGIVLGLGGSMLVAGENTLVSMINPAARETAANLLNLFFGVGAFLAPFIVMPVLKRRGFTAVLVGSSLIPAAVFLLHISLRFPPALQQHGFPLAQASSLLTEPKLLLLASMVFLYVGTEFSLWNWTVTFFTVERGYEQTNASRLVSAFAFTMILGRLGAKWVLAALGPEKTLLLSAVGAAICLGGMFRGQGRKFVKGSALAAGLFMAAIFPTSLGLAGRYFPALVGTAISLAITGGWIGAIAIPPSVGFVAERRGVARGLLIPLGAAAVMVVPPLILLALH